jgi:nitric oxide synthase oxygenase domain/subunit
MPRPTEMPVRTCRRCNAIWIEDAIMYEETDRCPHCGRYVGEPLLTGLDDFPWTGSGTSLKKLPLYFMTGGRMRFVEDPHNPIMTAGALNEADYRR